MKEITYSQPQAAAIASKFFGVSLPVSRDELKSCFRAACKRLHTDTSGADTKEQFIQMKAFYEGLCKQNPLWAFTESNGNGNGQLYTLDGIPLMELGLGLGPTKNGRDCNHCNHAGYTVEEISDWARCQWCMHGIAYVQPCRRCEGTGHYKKNGHVVGDCFNCKGTGIHQCKHAVVCSVCNGAGGTYVATPRKLFHICVMCQGTGEVEIFNPVIPKGRLL